MFRKVRVLLVTQPGVDENTATLHDGTYNMWLWLPHLCHGGTLTTATGYYVAPISGGLLSQCQVAPWNGGTT